MRTIILILSLSLIFLSKVSSQSSTKFRLPGFIQINDTLFANLSEVSIRDYAFYLREIRHRDSAKFIRSKPSDEGISWRVPYRNDYTIYDKIYDISDSSISYPTWIWFYPVVNVSKEQAIMCCEQLTKDYNSNSKHFSKKELKKFPLNLEFRLPTEQEWISIASSNLDTLAFPYGLSANRKSNNKPISIEYLNDSSGIRRHPLGSQSGWNYGLKNDSGLFNMPGNVWELVSDTDNVMGGSFDDPSSNCRVTSRKKYLKPEDTVGFRVIAVIKK